MFQHFSAVMLDVRSPERRRLPVRSDTLDVFARPFRPDQLVAEVIHSLAMGSVPPRLVVIKRSPEATVYAFSPFALLPAAVQQNTRKFALLPSVLVVLLFETWRH